MIIQQKTSRPSRYRETNNHMRHCTWFVCICICNLYSYMYIYIGVFICIDIGIAICLRMYVCNYIIVLFYSSTCIPNSSHLISSLQTLGHGLIAHRALQEGPIMANPSFCLQLVSYNDTERCCHVCQMNPKDWHFLQFWMLSFAK